MPKIIKALALEITPEQFLNSCSPTELMELEILILSPRYQNKMREPEGEVLPIYNPVISEDHENGN